MTNVDNYHLYRMSAAWLSMAYTAQNLRLPRVVDYCVEMPVLDAAHLAARHLRATCTGDLV